MEGGLVLNESRFTNQQVVILVIITLTGVLLAVSFNMPLIIGFTPGFIFLIGLVKRTGVSFYDIYRICWKGVLKTKTVIFILFLVSFILPSWHMSGTIEQLVGISLHLITPENFFLFTFFITLLFSMMLGTSVGTLSAVGIPIMSSALALGLPLDVTAGALISGAFVGDRTSPFSSAHQLLSHTVEVAVKNQLRAILTTTVIAIVCCSIFFWVLDRLHEERINDVSNFSWEQLSFLTLLPPMLLIVIVLLRIGIIYAFITSIIGACLLALADGISFFSLLHSLLFGAGGLGGGLSNMYSLLAFLALAGAYNGLLEEYQLIQPLLDDWLIKSATLAEDSIKTVLATLGISLISANQTLPIILTGRTFLNHWKAKQSKDELARVMADSTMLFPGLIPWSVLAIMCSSILGVPVLAYMPYALFLWVLPIITIFVSIAKQPKQGIEGVRDKAKASNHS